MSASVGINNAALSAMTAHSAAAASAVATSGIPGGIPMVPPRVQRVITTRPQVPISDQELRARVQWGHETSPHFSLTFDRVSYTARQAETLLATLEIAYSQIFHLTHESFADRCEVYAIDQRATGLLGRSVTPHYNSHEQSIYLVETSQHHADCDVVRTVAHAMRQARFTKHYYATAGWAALEEAFSIFLTERLGIASNAFPLYGTHPDLVASHLTGKGHAVARMWSEPMTNFSANELALLGAFFLYLGDTFSDDRVVAFSKSEDAITAETFQASFGETLEELEYAWTQRLPLSLVALMHDEQAALLQKWEQAIEGHRHS